MFKKHKIMTVILIIIAAAVLTALISAIVCSSSLKVTNYTKDIDGIDAPCRIVVISDLHSREYGKDNERLVALIAEQSPDAIFCVGDMLSRSTDADDIAAFGELVGKLTDIAPLYYTIGNHENEFYDASLSDVRSAVENAGGVFLNNEYIDVDIGGNTVRLVGILGGNSPWISYYNDDESLIGTKYEFLEDLRDCELPTLWLAHMPNMMIYFEPQNEFRMDLVLSGHVHGGLWRLPLIGGVISPTEGFFPDYDYGLYSFGNTDMILSGGLSGYDFVPRIFNRPEICVIDLI